MASDETAPCAPAKASRVYVQYTARLARTICERIAAGETLVAICAEAGMPNRGSVTRWARDRRAFRQAYHRAKAFGRRPGLGPTTTYCEVVAHEICVRVSEGETLTAISEDPAMPAMWTIMHWQRRSEAFAGALRLARQAQAERMADEGWRMALAAPPENARLLREQLAQLRWSAAIKSPRTHGRTKPADPPAEPQKPTTFLFKHFRLEEDPQTGLMRVVTYIPDPDSNQPMRDAEGPWKPRPGGLRTIPDQAPPGSSLAATPTPIVNKPHDPEGWL